MLFLAVRAEIQQPLLPHCSLPEDFFIGKVPVYNKDGRVLRLMNLTPGLLFFFNALSIWFLGWPGIQLKSHLMGTKWFLLGDKMF